MTEVREHAEDAEHGHGTRRVGPDSGPGDVFQLAQQLRIDAIRMSTAAGSGHPTSSMSAADIAAVLLSRHLRYDWQNPDAPSNDHLVLSKGHASPLLYAMFKAVGAITDDEVMTTYRKEGGRLAGHPTPILPWVDVATGSLGQGLPCGVGIALAGAYLERIPYRVWVLCGDGEMAEGSVWEALDKAAHYRLANLTVIVDVNRLGQTGPTELGENVQAYARRVEAFGCRAIEVDGHDVAALDMAFQAAEDSGQPTVILARTRKGRGFSEVEDAGGWHGKALPPDMAERAIAELGGPRDLVVDGRLPDSGPNASTAGPPPREKVKPGEFAIDVPRFEIGARVAPREAFGQALVALGVRPDVVVLDAEVGNSTFTEEFGKSHPARFFQNYIAEQQMVGSAVGLAVRGYRPYAATFAAFLTRAHDFIRMAAISGIDMTLCGTHCGVEIGEDGPSQMGLEDIAMMRAISGSTVVYPSDATSAARLTAFLADQPGISYLRATRGKYPVLYGPDEEFPIGGSKTLRDGADVTLVGAGVTVHECLQAAGALGEEGIAARVIDLYSVKPLDIYALTRAATETGGLVIVEDHHPEGGIGEAVRAALAEAGVSARSAHLAVQGVLSSATPKQQLELAGISSRHIAEAARSLLR